MQQDYKGVNNSFTYDKNGNLIFKYINMYDNTWSKINFIGFMNIICK